MKNSISAKEYLMQGYRLKERINMHRYELEELKSLATDVSSFGFEPRYNANRTVEAPFEKLLYRIYDMEQEHATMIEKLLAFKKEATEAIDKIPDQDERLILIYYYFYSLSFADIGKKLYIDRHTAIRWHNKALSDFSVPENAITIRNNQN